MVQSPEGRGIRVGERGRQAEQSRDWRIEGEEGRRPSQGVSLGLGSLKMDGPFLHWPILTPSPENWREPTAKRTEDFSQWGHPSSSLDPEIKPGRKGLTRAYLP